jgi:RND family efflux transporter MFP subunit
MSSGLTFRPRRWSILVAALAPAACGGSRTPAPQAPPARVQLAALEATPTDEVSEYVATLKSLRSTEVRPQVEGIIVRIDAKSGDRVRPGTRLLRIDARRQQAAVASQDATRAAREADLALARTELERVRVLYKGGAVSKQELDQADALVKRLEAERTAVEAQLREARVQLQYFDVVAPTSGIVGDIPVRVGTRVTPDTLLTTVDQNQNLEVHVSVPLERAPELKMGLPIELLDANGAKLADTTVSFISPRVDDQTQTVLVKGIVRSEGPTIRSLQFVRARLIFKTQPGLVVPVVAVIRINGKHFVYVAEQQDGKAVARQRPVELGQIIKDDYTVLGGLKANERVVISGVQKLADGAPINPQA